MDIKYIDHPCSTATKKEWNKKGYRVVDSRFAPVVAEPEVKKKSRKKSKGA